MSRDVCVPSDPGSDFVTEDVLFAMTEVKSSLLDLCASCSFAVHFSMISNRSLSTCIFPDAWKLSFVTL
jgi:hypothetical protein